MAASGGWEAPPSLLLLHLLQDGHNHVKLWALGWVLIHADLHQLADVGGYAGWDGWT